MQNLNHEDVNKIRFNIYKIKQNPDEKINNNFSIENNYQLKNKNEKNEIMKLNSSKNPEKTSNAEENIEKFENNPKKVYNNEYNLIKGKKNNENQSYDNSFNIKKLNDLNKNIELLQTRIKQARDLNNNPSGENNIKLYDQEFNYKDENTNLKNQQLNNKNFKYENNRNNTLINESNQKKICCENNYIYNPEEKEFRGNNNIIIEDQNYQGSPEKNYKAPSYSSFSLQLPKRNSNFENLNKKNLQKFTEDKSEKDFNSTNPEGNNFYSKKNNYNPKYSERISNLNLITKQKKNNFENNKFNQWENVNNLNNKDKSFSKLYNFSRDEIGYIPDKLDNSSVIITKSLDRSSDHGVYEKSIKTMYLNSTINKNPRNYNSAVYEIDGKNENKFKEKRVDFSKTDISPIKKFNNENNTSNLMDTNSKTIKNYSFVQNKIIRNDDKLKSSLRKELINQHPTFEKSRSEFFRNPENSTFSQNKINSSKINDFSNIKNNQKIFCQSNSNWNLFSSKNEMNKLKSDNLAHFFYDLIIIESNCENYKESLSLRPEVSLKGLFNYFNLSITNLISLVDFQHTLKELDIYLPLEDLKFAFKRFDIDLDCRLR